MKMIGKWLLVTMLVLSAFGMNQKAEAATNSDACYNGGYTCEERNITLRTDVNTYYKSFSSFVGVNIYLGDREQYYNWKLSFEKKYSGVWSTYYPADSKTGYVTAASSSSRTWSMIDFTTGEYRVVMDIVSDASGSTAEYSGTKFMYVTYFNVVQ